MITFSTASGSEYEIVSHPSGKMIRRVNVEHGKRADDKWVRLINDPTLEVGVSAILVLDSLAAYGEDDYGTPRENADKYTTRITSTVTEVRDAT